MTFGEKLKVLRKEKGYSQEEFAGLLNVSRQAVSKWESDRGTPETDKLLQISNMFGVTLDYLLKEESSDENMQTDSYYVSREMIDGFLSYKREQAKKIAVGVGLIVISDVFSCFSDYRQMLLPFYWGSMAIGIAILVWTFFQPKCYQEIFTKVLIFDDTLIKAFREESNRNRKRYVGMIVLSVLLFFFGSEFLFMVENTISREVCNALNWFMDAAAVMLLIIAGTSIHAENIITQNAEYIKRKNSRGKFAWVYIALPITILAVLIGFITNAWSPVFPIIFLFCALLVTVCKLLIEKRDVK
ncbi:helix-turn-helix domain-containing protein [Candidatus Avoscillospira sp. LCP25S3_F1]|uniref:helix-turn-helix domain-containing protein n=1 Tax=Candidatus Avoscillospira sp. LCP25S3_F1 TaxID=3438825 RepID=UPI003F90C67B